MRERRLPCAIFIPPFISKSASGCSSYIGDSGRARASFSTCPGLPFWSPMIGSILHPPAGCGDVFCCRSLILNNVSRQWTSFNTWATSSFGSGCNRLVKKRHRRTHLQCRSEANRGSFWWSRLVEAWPTGHASAGRGSISYVFLRERRTPWRGPFGAVTWCSVRVRHVATARPYSDLAARRRLRRGDLSLGSGFGQPRRRADDWKLLQPGFLGQERPRERAIERARNWADEVVFNPGSRD